jgi:signal transduction histidine kinase
MQQLLQNLLANAIKYRRSDEQLHVRISAEARDRHWRVAVADNGQGIDAEHLVIIFEPLKRLHGRDVPGTGMGLAMCRKIVERHGGRIWAESDGEDKGTTFYFEIPKKPTRGSACGPGGPPHAQSSRGT